MFAEHCQIYSLSFLGADQEQRGLWLRDWLYRMHGVLRVWGRVRVNELPYLVMHIMAFCFRISDASKVTNLLHDR